MSEISISIRNVSLNNFVLFGGNWQEINFLNNNKQVEAEDTVVATMIFMLHEMGISY